MSAPWLTECTVPFYWKLQSCVWCWDTEIKTLKMNHQRLLLYQSEEEGRAEQSRAELSHLAREGPHPKLPQSHAASLCCNTTELFHSHAFSQGCYITVELFALNKISFFTESQIGDSCWYWIDINNGQLAKITHIHMFTHTHSHTHTHLHSLTHIIRYHQYVQCG